MSSIAMQPQHQIPSKFLWLIAVVFAVLASMVAIASLLMAGWMAWEITILVVGTWIPLFAAKTFSTFRQYRWLAFFFVLAAAQSLHFSEHIAQMIQLHLIGLPLAQSHGLIGMLDFEWTHFIFDGIVIPACVFLLLFHFPRNPWLWILLPVAIWHGIEHFYIISVFLNTGIQGTPGLLSSGGAINGGLPLIRPDLHFLYNLVEETLILIGYAYQSRHLARVSKIIPVPAAENIV